MLTHLLNSFNKKSTVITSCFIIINSFVSSINQNKIVRQKYKG